VDTKWITWMVCISWYLQTHINLPGKGYYASYAPRGKDTKGFSRDIASVQVVVNMTEGEAPQFRKIILNRIMTINNRDRGRKERLKPCPRACRSISVTVWVYLPLTSRQSHNSSTCDFFRIQKVRKQWSLCTGKAGTLGNFRWLREIQVDLGKRT
jgi:hypothetical protein